jgi:pyruvate kinase
MAGTDNVIHKAMLWGVKMGMAQRGDPVRLIIFFKN